jgi:hypothetical protein
VCGASEKRPPRRCLVSHRPVPPKITHPPFSSGAARERFPSCGRKRVAPEVAVGDGAFGFWKAFDEMFAATRHQRCWLHKMLNVLDKFPKSVQSNAHNDPREIWLAPARYQVGYRRPQPAQALLQVPLHRQDLNDVKGIGDTRQNLIRAGCSHWGTVSPRRNGVGDNSDGRVAAVEKAIAHDCHCRLLCTVQSTSMRLNGLSLKPGHSFRQSRLIPAMRPPRAEFFCNRSRPFRALFHVRCTCAKSGRYHSTGSCALASRKEHSVAYVVKGLLRTH